VTVVGALLWHARANTATKGESGNARNAGQLGSWGKGYAVNELRGQRCQERKRPPECYTKETRTIPTDCTEMLVRPLRSASSGEIHSAGWPASVPGTGRFPETML
jgi:hypothetical protein